MPKRKVKKTSKDAEISSKKLKTESDDITSLPQPR